MKGSQRRRLVRLPVFFSNLQRHCIYTSGKVVILDSVFCVLQAIIALQGMRVISGAVIKMEVLSKVDWYSDGIDKHMEAPTVGEYDSFRGKLNGIGYDVFCMKKPEYMMKIMSTFHIWWTN